MPWRTRSRASTASTPIRWCRPWPRSRAQARIKPAARPGENPKDLDARTDALYGAWLAANFRAAVGPRTRHRATRAAMVQPRPCPHPRRRDALRHRLQRQGSARRHGAHQARAWRDRRGARPLRLSTCGSACRPASRASACARRTSERPSTLSPRSRSSTRGRSPKADLARSHHAGPRGRAAAILNG